jgi:hypothetical protein
MSNKTIVRFTKAWRSWFAGDVAGFDKDTAEALIGGGVATSYSSIAAAAAQISKEAPGVSQPKAGKDKQANKRGGAAKPDTVTQPGGSLLAGTSTSALDGAGAGAGSDLNQDDNGGSAEGDGSGSEGGANGAGGVDENDPDEEKP